MNSIAVYEVVSALFTLKISVSERAGLQLLPQGAQGFSVNTGTSGTSGDDDEPVHPDPGATGGN